MNNRLEYIDILRGFAIITVVMGHIIQYNIHGIAASACFDFIYSFHMFFSSLLVGVQLHYLRIKIYGVIFTHSYIKNVASY